MKISKEEKLSFKSIFRENNKIMQLYCLNKSFIQAILLHISLLIMFAIAPLFNFQKEKISNQEFIKVTTYDKIPFVDKMNAKINELALSDFNDTLANLKENVLSYSIEGFEVKFDDTGVQESKKVNDALEKEFKEILEVSNDNSKSIFNHTQDIKTISKIFGYIKKQSEKIDLISKMTNNEEELLRSENLLLSYEKYQKTLFYNILKNWNYPEFSGKDWKCKVGVLQSSTGNVISIDFVDCEDNVSFRKAVKITLFKSSPLPLPDNMELYNELMYFTFKGN